MFKDMTDQQLIRKMQEYEDMLIEEPMLEYDESWLKIMESIITEIQDRDLYTSFEEEMITDNIVEDDFENYH